MFIVYAISSVAGDYMYVDITSDLQNCLTQHQSGQHKKTRSFRPLIILHTASFQTRQEAKNQQHFLKSALGKEYLQGKWMQ